MFHIFFFFHGFHGCSSSKRKFIALDGVPGMLNLLAMPPKQTAKTLPKKDLEKLMDIKLEILVRKKKWKRKSDFNFKKLTGLQLSPRRGDNRSVWLFITHFL